MADNDKKRYYWVKLDRNFFEKYKIKSLLSEKNGESFCLIYQQLMCECLNYIDENNNGILRFSKQRAYTINELANVINRKPKQLTEALKMLENKELLKVLDDGTIVIFDVNVGSLTGQTLRKNKGNNVVEITNELPNNYLINEVENNLDIRDKSIDIRDKNIDDDINNINGRMLEIGTDPKIISKALKIFANHKYPHTSGFYQRIINTLTDANIYDKEAYISEVARNYVLD